MEKANTQLDRYVSSPPIPPNEKNKKGDYYIDGIITLQELASMLDIKINSDIDFSFDYFIKDYVLKRWKWSYSLLVC